MVFNLSGGSGGVLKAVKSTVEKISRLKINIKGKTNTLRG